MSVYTYIYLKIAHFQLLNCSTTDDPYCTHGRYGNASVFPALSELRNQIDFIGSEHHLYCLRYCPRFKMESSA